MREKLLVCPSTDPIKKESENFKNELKRYVKEISDCGAGYIHCDIMDGKFVPRKTFDASDVAYIKSITTTPLDCHLMTIFSKNEIIDFISAGANIITLHIENFVKNGKLKTFKLKRMINLIHKNKRFVGISIKPKTEINLILKIIKKIDLILIMSVEPGKSGQKFIENSFEKIKKINEIKNKNKLDFLIEVDGGITPEIAGELKRLGVDMVVSGNYIFSAENKKEIIEKFS